MCNNGHTHRSRQVVNDCIFWPDAKKQAAAGKVLQPSRYSFPTFAELFFFCFVFCVTAAEFSESPPQCRFKDKLFLNVHLDYIYVKIRFFPSPMTVDLKNLCQKTCAGVC